MAAQEIIASGKLGRVQHVDIKITWTRTAAYYRSSDWRGTWRGEGGGVLLNQAPHELDLLCHLLGLPSRVVAWTRTLVHAIETEDTVQAMMEWDGGTLGSLHISTAEAGQAQRLEIIGTGGHLSIYNGGLDLKGFDSDLIDFINSSPEMFAAPGLNPSPVTLPAGNGNHQAIYANLYTAITEGVPLVADGRSAARSLELANAMTYSSYTGSTVQFPLDRAAYTHLLHDLQGR
jgi:predicted dehydrogenase